MALTDNLARSQPMALRDNTRRPDLAARFDRAIQNDPLLKTLFEVMFDQENRIRTLEGNPPVSRSQALTSLRNMYTGT
jgi:hypothetical protein